MTRNAQNRPVQAARRAALALIAGAVGALAPVVALAEEPEFLPFPGGAAPSASPAPASPSPRPATPAAQPPFPEALLPSAAANETPAPAPTPIPDPRQGLEAQQIASTEATAPEGGSILDELAGLNELEMLLRKKIAIARLQKELGSLTKKEEKKASPGPILPSLPTLPRNLAEEEPQLEAPQAQVELAPHQVLIISGKGKDLSADLQGPGGAIITVKPGDALPFRLQTDQNIVKAITKNGVMAHNSLYGNNYNLPMAAAAVGAAAGAQNSGIASPPSPLGGPPAGAGGIGFDGPPGFFGGPSPDFGAPPQERRAPSVGPSSQAGEEPQRSRARAAPPRARYRSVTAPAAVAP